MLWVYSEFSIKRFVFIIIFVCRSNLSSDMMFSDMKFITAIANFSIFQLFAKFSNKRKLCFNYYQITLFDTLINYKTTVSIFSNFFHCFP